MPSPPKRAKVPQQRRSVATVDAIVEAAVQVLHQGGKAKLTTTRIAHRAGVSVGTLYQYFPDKTALLQEALCRHLDLLADAMELACSDATGLPLAEVAAAIAAAWVRAKFGSVVASIALYSVVDDIEGRPIAAVRSTRIAGAMARAFRAAPCTMVAHPELVAQTLLGAMSGVSRDLLDPAATPAQRNAIAEQLTALVVAYVTKNSAPQ